MWSLCRDAKEKKVIRMAVRAFSHPIRRELNSPRHAGGTYALKSALIFRFNVVCCVTAPVYNRNSYMARMGGAHTGIKEIVLPL